MKDYELTVLIHPDLEMNPDPAIDKVKSIVESFGGKITKEENEGKKRLAYSISGQDFALYYYFDVSLPAEAPAKISSAFNITEEVLRYLLVRVDERKAKFAARRAERQEGEEEKTIVEKGE
jgi:small subunit ribosomal protein S6